MSKKKSTEWEAAMTKLIESGEELFQSLDRTTAKLKKIAKLAVQYRRELLRLKKKGEK